MIREVTDKDYDGLIRLYEQLTGNAYPGKEEVIDVWNQVLEDGNHHLIVAEEDGKIVATCVCVIIQNLTRHQKPYAFIENVVTDKDYRKRGIGTACLEYAKEIAKKEGCYKMMLMTGVKEESVLNFYEQAGYNQQDKIAFIQWI